MLDLKKMLTKISKYMKTTETGECDNYTAPVGSITGVTYARHGNVVNLMISGRSGGTGASGTNICELTIGDSKLIPAFTSTGSVIYGKYMFGVVANPNGKIIVRNTSNDTFSQGTFEAHIIYLVGGGVLLKWLKGSILKAFSHRRKAVASC